MDNRGFLKILFIGISVTMLILTIATSLKSNILDTAEQVKSTPWFAATLFDFYFNITILSAWVIYREASKLTALLWVGAFILLGSIATCFYVFLQLVRLKPNESIDKILIKKV